MSQVPKGTKPLSQRKAPGSGSFSFTPRNPLDIPTGIQKQLDAKGMEGRWLDAKQMADRGNFHKNYWEIFKRDTSKDQELGLTGLPPDGTIRSGTCILGARPIGVGDEHRKLLKEKRIRLKNAVKAKSEEAVQLARKAGAKILEDETEVTEEVHTYQGDE